MIQPVYTMQAEVYALIILLIIYFDFRKRADLKNTSNRIFIKMIQINMAIIVLDLVMVTLNGVPGTLIHGANLIITAIYYCLNPVSSFLWMIYVHNLIFHNEKRIKQFLLPALLPVFINGVLSVLSIFTGWLFFIGDDNVYHRGSLFFILPLMCYFYLILSFAMILINRRRIRRMDFIPLLFFAVPPFVGGILQGMFFGLSTLWPGTVLSLLIIYIFIQSRNMNTDHLTGLYNRREFDYYLEDWLSWHTRNRHIVGFMLDLDHFKAINDTYGHRMGDAALISMSKILHRSFRHNDFVARIGGDEFAVILEIDDPDEIEALKHRLQEQVTAFNDQNKDPYRLSISIGCGLFFGTDGQTLREFFEELDHRMYQNKAHKRAGTA